MAAGSSRDHAASSRSHAARRRAGDPDARQYARAGAAISARSRRERARGRIIRRSRPRRATICRRSRTITTCSSPPVRISICGTPSIITSWRRRRRSLNGSKARRCSRFSRRCPPPIARNFLPLTRRRCVARLQAALRRQSAAAIPAPVHPGGAMRSLRRSARHCLAERRARRSSRFCRRCVRSLAASAMAPGAGPWRLARYVRRRDTRA